MSTVEPRVWHYIKPNEQTRVPRNLIVIDTAATTARIHKGHDQSWRVAVAWFRKARKGRAPHEVESAYRTPRDLWQAVSDHCGKSGRTVAWAHNLGYDVRIAACFEVLPDLGWSLEAHNVATRGTWLVWRRDRATLTMVDTASVWPTTLSTIGKWFGMGRLATPGPDAPDDDWVAVCRRDVEIIRTAVTTYLDWIERADMGNWQLTGAGMAWAAYRHKFLSHNLLVHGDRDALDAERRAMWTGRCEAYWHGSIGYQEVQEWDFRSAYAHVARDLDVPIQLVGPLSGGAIRSRGIGAPNLAVLADVTITTAVPTVPTLNDGRILWPVGTFRSVLWDIEIQAAVDDGATVTYHRGWLYRTAPALRDMADWILTGLAASDEDCPLWLKAIMRHWSRAWIGRFAMQYSTWEPFATMPELSTDRRRWLDDVEDTEYDTMQVGRDMWRESGTVDWAQSMPAVTGYVMAACRVKLWRLIQRMPPGSVLYCDTDSLMLTDRWNSAIGQLTQIGVGAGLRLKSTYRGFSIMGPRQIVTGERVRMAGIPVLATRTGRSDFEGSVGESLGVALASGRASTVRTFDRHWHVAGSDRRRSGPGIGWTRPYTVDTESMV